MLCGPRKRDLPSTLKMTRGNCHAILFPHIFWLRGRVGAIKDLKLADPAQIAFEAPTGRPDQPAAAGENEHIGEFRFTLPERSFSHANQRQKLTIGWHPGQPARGAQTWRRRNATFRSALLFMTLKTTATWQRSVNELQCAPTTLPPSAPMKISPGNGALLQKTSDALRTSSWKKTNSLKLLRSRNGFPKRRGLVARATRTEGTVSSA
jgi:hypothetical protein